MEAIAAVDSCRYCGGPPALKLTEWYIQITKTERWKSSNWFFRSIYLSHSSVGILYILSHYLWCHTIFCVCVYSPTKNLSDLAAWDGTAISEIIYIDVMYWTLTNSVISLTCYFRVFNGAMHVNEWLKMVVEYGCFNGHIFIPLAWREKKSWKVKWLNYSRVNLLLPNISSYF